MTTGFIDIDLVGNDAGVQKMLLQIDSACSPVGLAVFLHGSVAPWLKERAKNRFASEGDDASEKWAALRPTTVERRENDGFSGAHPINVRTRALEQYITGSDSDVIASPGLSQLTYPSGKGLDPLTAKKLKTAQVGDSKSNTVARPVLALSEKDLAAVMTQLAFHIKGYRKVGRR